MRNPGTVLAALVATLVVGVGGAAFALAGAGPATSAPSPRTAAVAPVGDLLAGSYQPAYGRLSVAGRATISSRKAPEVSGKPKVGGALTVTSGTWKPSTVKVTYRWYAGTKKIKGARGHAYSPVAKDAGKVLTARVVASKKDYRPGTADADAGLVKGGELSSVKAPTVRGAAKVGTTLRVTSGTWSSPDVSLTYAWLKGRSMVSTDRRYTVQPTDRGTTLRVRVTARKPGFKAASVTTSRTDAVQR